MRTFLLNAFFATILFLIPNLNFGQLQPPPPILGDAASFAVFTSVGALTSDGATVVTGDVGSNVGGVVINPPGVVIGAIHDADGVSALAAPDVDDAYMYLDGILGGTVIGTTLGSGQSLTPDVYILGAASTLDGELILDAEGDPGAIFIFQIDGAFATTVNSTVTLANGASFCNVYWQVNGAVTLGEGSSFLGTIIANGAIHALEASALSGRALTRAGAIDLHNNNINNGLPIASTITAGGATTFCAGGSVELSGNVGGVWSTGATTASITVTASGDYFVTNTGECGEEISNHIIVTVNALPSCTITGDISLCTGQSSEICAPDVMGYTYVWSTGATTRCITVSTAGTRSVTVTDANGCSSVCSATVTVNPPPSCTITGDISLCTGQSSEICAPDVMGYTYVWSTGATTRCITVSTAGTRSVTVTDANGCSSVCSATVTVNPPPSCTITGDISLCTGQSSEICAPDVSGYTYVWSTGATTRCITVSTAGTRSVTVTDTNGCSSVCSATVTVNPPPSCTITGDISLCTGQSSEICAPDVSGYTYVWSTGATTRCITVSTAGTRSVTVTDTNGCSSVCSATVTVNPPPSCTITGDISLCTGQSSEICAPDVSGYTYVWSTGATTRCITVSTAGTRSVTVTDANGCSSVCSATVTVSPASNCTITGDDIICEGESTQLCTAAGAANYLWSNGGTTNCITVNQAGTYSVTVTYANGCTSVCSIIVNPGESVCIIVNVTPASCDYVEHCPNGPEPGTLCDDGNPNTINDRINDECECAGTPDNGGTCTVCSQVDDGDDDAEEIISNGDIDIDNSHFQLVMDGSKKQLVGMRFNTLNIPQGAIIQSAYIQFTADVKDNKNPISLEIYGEDADDAITFDDNDGNISDRNKTSAFATWSPANWLNDGDSGPAQQTSDIAAVIQEIVNRAGFSGSSSIVIIIKGTGNRTAISYDKDKDEAPILCVTYQAPDCLAGGNDDDDDDDDNGSNGTGGSFELSVDCGVGPFDYTVTNTSIEVVDFGTEDEIQNIEINNLAPGTYTIVVTDANGNTTECTVIITQDAMECIIANVTPATCAYMEQCPNGPEPGTLCDDGNPNTINDRITDDCECAGTPDNGNTCTVCVQVDHKNDDAEEKTSNGDMDLTSSDLEMVMDGSTKQLVGMRFNTLNIPQGAIIQSAYIQFTVDETNNKNPISLEIYGENTDNASAFNSNDGNISNRNKTVAFATWSPANWLNKGDAGPAQQTGDISAVIQEIVNRAGFTSSSSIVIIIKGTGNRTAVSYDEDEDEAPILCVTFQASDCPDEGGNNDDDYDGGSFELSIDCGVSPFDYTVTNTSNEVVDFGTEDEIENIEINNLAPGTYTIVVTDASGATTECEVTISQEMPCDGGGDRLGGEASKSETNVEIRPNPTAYQDVSILIDIVGGQRYTKHTVLVSDISGHIVINESLLLEEGLSTYIIPNELLMNGIYFVRIQNQQGDVFVLRFVKINED